MKRRIIGIIASVLILAVILAIPSFAYSGIIQTDGGMWYSLVDLQKVSYFYERNDTSDYFYTFPIDLDCSYADDDDNYMLEYCEAVSVDNNKRYIGYRTGIDYGARKSHAGVPWVSSQSLSDMYYWESYMSIGPNYLGADGLKTIRLDIGVMDFSLSQFDGVGSPIGKSIYQDLFIYGLGFIGDTPGPSPFSTVTYTADIFDYYGDGKTFHFERSYTLEGLATFGYNQVPIFPLYDPYVQSFVASHVGDEFSAVAFDLSIDLTPEESAVYNYLVVDTLHASNNKYTTTTYADALEAFIDYRYADYDKDVVSNAIDGIFSLFNVELLPGITIWGLLALLLGVPILIWALRLFAGG